MPKGVSASYSGAARSAAARKGAASRARAKVARTMAAIAIPPEEIAAMRGTATDRHMRPGDLQGVIARALVSVAAAKAREAGEP